MYWTSGLLSFAGPVRRMLALFDGSGRAAEETRRAWMRVERRMRSDGGISRCKKIHDLRRRKVAYGSGAGDDTFLR